MLDSFKYLKSVTPADNFCEHFPERVRSLPDTPESLHDVTKFNTVCLTSHDPSKDNIQIAFHIGETRQSRRPAGQCRVPGTERPTAMKGASHNKCSAEIHST